MIAKRLKLKSVEEFVIGRLLVSIAIISYSPQSFAQIS